MSVLKQFLEYLFSKATWRLHVRLHNSVPNNANYCPFQIVRTTTLCPTNLILLIASSHWFLFAFFISFAYRCEYVNMPQRNPFDLVTCTSLSSLMCLYCTSLFIFPICSTTSNVTARMPPAQYSRTAFDQLFCTSPNPVKKWTEKTKRETITKYFLTRFNKKFTSFVIEVILFKAYLKHIHKQFTHQSRIVFNWWSWSNVWYTESSFKCVPWHLDQFFRKFPDRKEMGERLIVRYKTILTLNNTTKAECERKKKRKTESDRKSVEGGGGRVKWKSPSNTHLQRRIFKYFSQCYSIV